MSSKAGRTAKPVIVQPVIDPALDQAKLDGAMVAMREESAEQREQETMQLAQACQAVGGALMARLHKSFSHAAEVSMFLQVRDLPLALLRRIPIPEIAATAAASGGIPQGEVAKSAATAANLDEFCRLVFGRGATALREEAQNFNVLGEQAYETASRLGLGRGVLRVTRALPPEKLEIVRTAIGNGNTKAEVLSVIEDLAEKVQQAEAETAEAKAELKAAEEVAASKSKTIDKLQRDLKRIETLPPDQQLAGLKKEATEVADDAEAAILGDLRQALLVLSNHGEERGLHAVFMAGLVGQVQAQLNALRKEFNLPDVSAAQDQKLLAEMEQWDK